MKLNNDRIKLDQTLQVLFVVEEKIFSVSHGPFAKLKIFIS